MHADVSKAYFPFHNCYSITKLQVYVLKNTTSFVFLNYFSIVLIGIYICVYCVGSPARKSMVNFSQGALEDIGRASRNNSNTSSCYMD